jgi:hypothetical protein
MYIFQMQSMGQYARQRLFLVDHAKSHLILLRISCGGGGAIRVVVVCVFLVMNPQRRLRSLVYVCVMVMIDVISYNWDVLLFFFL